MEHFGQLEAVIDCKSSEKVARLERSNGARTIRKHLRRKTMEDGGEVVVKEGERNAGI